MEYLEVVKRYGIGLTGGIATGKSTVSKILRKLGYTVIDADELARKAVEKNSPGLAQIVEHFGAVMLTAKGNLDRKKMANLIFTDPEQRQALEAIVHPIIHNLLKQQLEKLGLIESKNFWFYEASLLFETGTSTKFKEVWATFCPENVQLQRLLKRDRYSMQFAKKILHSQMSAKEKAEKADFVINTDAPIDQLEPKVKDALDRLAHSEMNRIR